MTNLEFYKWITAGGLTPNQYFAILFQALGVKQKTLFNSALELSRLKREGYLTEGLNFTQKLLDTKLFDDIESYLIEDDQEAKSLDRRIGRYIGMFPASRLPSGAPARASLPSVRMQFNEFFNQYDYSWDVIYEATQNYINHYAERNYEYMRNARNFILKDGESQLALECDMILNKEKEFSFDKDI